MQLLQPSLLSYLQRFNQKRRIQYKIHFQPNPRGETPTPRIKAPVKMPSRAQFGVDDKARAPSMSVPQ
jgi:hypothetical protein